MAEEALRDPAELLVGGPDRHALRVGLLVPVSGTLGLVGPAAIDCAVLATEEVNAAGGVGGRPLELVLVDAGRAPAEVARETGTLLDAGLVEVLAGVHASDVHRAVEHAVAGRAPYVFTPPHEGGARRAGVVLMGESPTEQLAPPVRWLTAHRRARRWALVGNDYIWPRAMHGAARRLLRDAGADVVLERLVPLGQVDPGPLIDALRRHRADALLLSLVGRDLVVFNRTFRHAGMGDTVVRLSGALEENGLLAAGGDESGELYATMRSFATMRDERQVALHERHRARFGAQAPVVGAYAEGCYDGLHLTAALGAAGATRVADVTRVAGRLLSGTTDRQVRRAWAAAPLGPPPRRVHLARADGFDLSVVASF
ncbi:MAG: ABC transporter substrate-binding protein [Streptosporangiales bacterium]|nr:ABC transporter substrate-binding protein [Streptosporangiales bacterium]